jgi:hypothetical protein
MSMRLKLAAALVSAVAVIASAAVWVSAQVVRVEPVTPTVMAGPDVGFRVEGLRAGMPVGRVVLRINGQWVEADLASPTAPRPIR